MKNEERKERKIDPAFLLLAYENGYFPMAESKEGEIHWYSPDPRTVIELEGFKISRSLRATIRKGIFEIRINTRFQEVIEQCSNRPETWISKEIIASYVLLHSSGYAHSVEAWKDGSLAGGLYGVAIGGAFFGESMFSLERDASKVALVALVDRLKLVGFTLLDIQFMTEHLFRFGAREIPKEEYLRRLSEATTLSVSFAILHK